MGSNYTSSDHVYVGATYVALPKGLAGQGARRGTVRVPADTKVDILEVVCLQCRRSYDDVEGTPCAAANPELRDHLVGGPSGSSATGERKKRKHPYHDCAEVGCSLGGSAATATG